MLTCGGAASVWTIASAMSSALRTSPISLLIFLARLHDERVALVVAHQLGLDESRLDDRHADVPSAAPPGAAPR